jgi:hypothetical protein
VGDEAGVVIQEGEEVRPVSCWYEGLPQTGTAVCLVWTR